MLSRKKENQLLKVKRFNKLTKKQMKMKMKNKLMMKQWILLTVLKEFS